MLKRIRLPQRRLMASLLCLALLSAGATAQGQAAASSSAQRAPRINPRSLTGTYRYGRSEWMVLALGGNRLRVEFLGVYEFRLSNGERMAHTGTASGIVTLAGDAATFVPEDFERCRITLRFSGRRLIVNQTGMDSDCGFGHNVYANGTYVKRSNRPPRFEEN